MLRIGRTCVSLTKHNQPVNHLAVCGHQLSLGAGSSRPPPPPPGLLLLSHSLALGGQTSRALSYTAPLRTAPKTSDDDIYKMLGLSGSKTNSSESPADTSRLQSSGDVIDGGGSAVLQGGSTVQSAADGSVQNVLSESSQSVAADANLSIGTGTEFKSAFDAETTSFVSNLSEPSFVDLGLSSGWPSGMAQTLMEFFHMDLGLPWWQVIAITTVILRSLVIPLNIMAIRNMTIMNNNQPTIQKLQVETSLALARGESDKARFAEKALNNFYKANNCHPVRAIWPLIFQGSFFTSMFFALRGMCSAPVPSLSTGGIYWFTDLTLTDPLFLLPILASTTIYLQLYFGADGMNAATMPPIMKKVLYALPLLTLTFSVNFPAAINLYWLTNNILSVIQAKVIRRPEVRAKLGIAEMIVWKPEDLPMTNFYSQLSKEVEITRKKNEKIKYEVEREKKAKLDKEQEHRLKLLEAFDEEEKNRKKR